MIASDTSMETVAPMIAVGTARAGARWLECLTGKSALITGGGGIGRATALAFAREGARVAVADLMAELPRATSTGQTPPADRRYRCRATCPETRTSRAMIEAVVGAHGRLDCAFQRWDRRLGVDAVGKKTAEWSEEAFDRMIAVNLKGVWLCMRHELPQMQNSGRRCHRQHRVDRRGHRFAELIRLCRGQARRHRADQHGRIEYAEANPG